MRLLLLTPYFHPYQNPRAYRWTAIAKEWARQGWEVHVVCSHHPDILKTAQWEGICLHPAGFNSAKELAYSVFKKMPRRGENSPGKSSPFPALLNNLLLRPWYWPDDAWLWIRPARRKALHLMQTQRFDALVSVSLPFSAHWAAKGLKASTWLADIGDPFSLQTAHTLNNHLFYRRKNLKAERQVLECANQIVVTNEGMRKAYLEAFPGLTTPIHVIPPLASPGQVDEKTPEEYAGPIQMGYFGSFFRHIREPEPMLRFFEQLAQSRKDWSLHFYGDIFENFRPVFDRFPSLRPHLHFHGIAGREEAGKAMQEMDILVLLGNTSSFQLPSKWADYLLTGKPVLHLMQTPEDPALPMVEHADHVHCFPLFENQDLPDLNLLAGRKPPRDSLNEWGQRFSPSAVAAAYAALLRS